MRACRWRCCCRRSPRSPIDSCSSPSFAAHPPSTQINLFLRIIRRREDGYHDLASLFHVIDLGESSLARRCWLCRQPPRRRRSVGCRRAPALASRPHPRPSTDSQRPPTTGDDMAFEVLAGTAAADTLSCDMAGVPTDASNLVIKVQGVTGPSLGPPWALVPSCMQQRERVSCVAAGARATAAAASTPPAAPPREIVPLPPSHPQALDLFRFKTGCTQRFAVDLRKRVPHGAGARRLACASAGRELLLSLLVLGSWSRCKALVTPLLLAPHRRPGRRLRQRGHHAVGGQRAVRAARDSGAAARVERRDRQRHFRVLLQRRRLLHRPVRGLCRALVAQAAAVGVCLASVLTPPC